MSTIAAGNTLTTGFVSTSDTTGNLVFQTNGTTTALTLTTGQNATLANNVSVVGSVSAVNTFGFKNRIINGGMTIDQRNAGASVSVNGNDIYTLDRFKGWANGGGVFSVQQSSTAPANFTYSALLTVTTADASVAAGDNYRWAQAIEGYNVADLAFGTANAKTITVSFWVRSNLTGTYGGSIYSATASRSYVYQYTISSANTWEQKTVTIPGDTSGSWNTTNGNGMVMYFDLGSGSTYQNATGVWVSGEKFSTSGNASWIGTLSNNLYITGVQLEVGSQATSFDFRDYGREFILCQRYYETGIGYVLGNAPAAGYYLGGPNGFRVTKRTSPTVILTTTNVYASSNLALGTAYVSGFNAYATSTSSSGLCETQGTYTASAEL